MKALRLEFKGGNPFKPEPAGSKILFFEAKEPGATVSGGTWTDAESPKFPDIEISVDGGSTYQHWNCSYDSEQECYVYDIVSLGETGDRVYLRGVNDYLAEVDYDFQFITEGDLKLGDSVQSLVDGIVESTTAIDMRYLFSGTTISEVENGLLPATTLVVKCYEFMFSSTKIKRAPCLPALTLQEECYGGMFEESDLETPPELPATVLAPYCYDSMFLKTKITQAPDLDAPVLVEGCYCSMFEECSNLSAIRCLATNPNNDSTDSWAANVNTEGTFTKKSGVDWSNTYPFSGIPANWTVTEV